MAATIAAAALAGIRVVSTGGIGGVHPGRDGQDVSADLIELSRRAVCVVCAGPKSTLDAGATLERLETLGVPVIGWVVSQPLTSDLAIPIAELGADESAPVRGPDRTPAELSRLQARLGDRVIQANVALLERNASLAGELAAALVRLRVAASAHA